MTKFKPDRGQKEILSVLAHCLMASHIDSNVKGMHGFFKSYLKDGLDDRSRQIYEAFQDESKTAMKNLAAMLEEDRAK